MLGVITWYGEQEASGEIRAPTRRMSVRNLHEAWNWLPSKAKGASDEMMSICVRVAAVLGRQHLHLVLHVEELRSWKFIYSHVAVVMKEGKEGRRHKIFPFVPFRTFISFQSTSPRLLIIFLLIGHNFVINRMIISFISSECLCVERRHSACRAVSFSNASQFHVKISWKIVKISSIAYPDDKKKFRIVFRKKNAWECWTFKSCSRSDDSWW